MLIFLTASSRRDEEAKRKRGEGFQCANSENVDANEPMNRRMMFFSKENKPREFVANRTNFSLLPHNGRCLVERNEDLLLFLFLILLNSATLMQEWISWTEHHTLNVLSEKHLHDDRNRETDSPLNLSHNGIALGGVFPDDGCYENTSERIVCCFHSKWLSYVSLDFQTDRISWDQLNHLSNVASFCDNAQGFLAAGCWSPIQHRQRCVWTNLFRREEDSVSSSHAHHVFLQTNESILKVENFSFSIRWRAIMQKQ